MNDFTVTVIIFSVILLVLFLYYFSKSNSHVSLNQFPDGNFMIVPTNTPYKCLSSSNGSTSFLQCNVSDTTQYYTYNTTTNTIVTSASLCLTKSSNSTVYDSPCIDHSTDQQFFYNDTNTVIQNTTNVSANTLYCNVCNVTDTMVLSNSSNTTFNSIPPIANGLLSGRYVRISVSSIMCLNMTGISVLSNPWDSFNIAWTASLTQSSPTLCTGSPWIQLDFGKEIPITQITIQSDRIPVSPYTLVGSVVSLSNHNNVTTYVSDPIPTNAEYTVFNIPSTTPIQSIEAVVPVSCSLSASLYKFLHPGVTNDAWTHYNSKDNNQHYKWYGPSCSTSNVSGIIPVYRSVLQNCPSCVKNCPSCPNCPSCSTCPPCAGSY